MNRVTLHIGRRLNLGEFVGFQKPVWPQILHFLCFEDSFSFWEGCLQSRASENERELLSLGFALQMAAVPEDEPTWSQEPTVSSRFPGGCRGQWLEPFSTPFLGHKLGAELEMKHREELVLIRDGSTTGGRFACFASRPSPQCLLIKTSMDKQV